MTGPVGVFGGTGGGRGDVKITGGELGSAAGVVVGFHGEYGGTIDLATVRKKVGHLRRRLVVGLCCDERDSTITPPFSGVGVEATRHSSLSWRLHEKYTERCCDSGSAREVFRGKASVG